MQAYIIDTYISLPIRAEFPVGVKDVDHCCCIVSSACGIYGKLVIRREKRKKGSSIWPQLQVEILLLAYNRAEPV